MTEPRIYVASLSDYNAGILHGVWIDASDDVDSIWEQINAMLASSPEFKQFPQGGPAEEWAIHDYEGFGSLDISEYASIEGVAKMGAAIAEASDPDAMTAWLGIAEQWYEDDDSQISAFDDHYRGTWKSFKDYIMESELGDLFLGLCSLAAGSLYETDRERSSRKEIVEHVSNYIDWDLVARDLASDYTIVDSPNHEVFIFEETA